MITMTQKKSQKNFLSKARVAWLSEGTNEGYYYGRRVLHRIYRTTIALRPRKSHYGIYKLPSAHLKVSRFVFAWHVRRIYREQEELFLVQDIFRHEEEPLLSQATRDKDSIVQHVRVSLVCL